jgi:chitinase
MKIIPCLFIALLLSVSVRISAQIAPVTGPQVVAYYASWNLYAAQPYLLTDIPGDRLTQLVYAFAVISESGECTYGDEWADAQAPYPGDPADKPVKGHFGQIAALRERFPALKITLAIGGWTGSGRFSDVALTPERRAKFVESCVAFMRLYGFDGLDIDWEYPVAEGAPGNSRRPEDKPNLTFLLSAFRTALDEAGQTDGRTYTLTLAAPSAPALWQHFEWEQIAPLLDHIFLMAYDMAGTWSAVTASHAPLYADPNSPVTPALSADLTVQAYLSMGVPAGKLILGVPFYGKAWSGAGGVGLYQPYVRPSDDLPYQQIADEFLGTRGITTNWNEAGQFPWVYRASDGMVISYDDARSLRLKAVYALEQGLGGVGLWEISQDDDTHTLLNALWAGLQPGGS